jgi:hypothetical protein
MLQIDLIPSDFDVDTVMAGKEGEDWAYYVNIELYWEYWAGLNRN